MKLLVPMMVITLILFFSAPVHSLIYTEATKYKHGESPLEGYLAYDDSITEERPGILVVHDWHGINTDVKKQVEKIAGLGYVVFAIDMYGQGVRPESNQEAALETEKYRKDRQLMRDRAQAGLAVLRRHPLVNAKQMAAIGYGFGGQTVLELARSGTDLLGVVSFYGNLDTPTPQNAKNIQSAILILHGADDPFVTNQETREFQKEMSNAKVDWYMLVFGGAVRGFTDPASGGNPATGIAYDKKTDDRAWEATKDFLFEIFK